MLIVGKKYIHLKSIFLVLIESGIINNVGIKGDTNMTKIYKHAAKKIRAYLYAMTGIFRSAGLLDDCLILMEPSGDAISVKEALEALIDLTEKETRE